MLGLPRCGYIIGVGHPQLPLHHSYNETVERFDDLAS